MNMHAAPFATPATQAAPAATPFQPQPTQFTPPPVQPASPPAPTPPAAPMQFTPQPAPAVPQYAPSASQAAQPSASDRRQGEQPPQRMIGKVVSIDGARATIATKASNAEHISLDFWSIGRLISINLGQSRIVAMVYEMAVQQGQWEEGKENILLVQVELVGEVVDLAAGGRQFRRGIATYPWLGATAHRIRSDDLRSVFDLGSRRGVEIGRVSQDESIAAVVSMEDMLSKHFSVVGTTGVGKSSAVALLVRKAIETKPDLRALVLDPHNEYSHAFRDISVTLDVNTLELPHWLFKFEEFLDVIYRGRPAPDSEADILRELVPLAKSQFAVSQSASSASGSLLKRSTEGLAFGPDSPAPYRMLDLIALLDEMMGKLDPRHDRYHLRVLKGRLETLCTDARYRFMFGRGATEDNIEFVLGKLFRIPMDDRPITVLQLAGLPSEVLNSVVSVLARLSFDIAMWSSGRFEVLVLCEEAHRYVPQDTKLGFAPTRQAIARIAKEGRKYGCYIGVVTQRPGELDPTILSQCSTVFAMRLGNDRDQEIIRASISDSSASQITFLSAIGNREAIAFGEGVATPMRMKFTLQDKTLLPSAATSHGVPDAQGNPGQISLRSVVSRMRGNTEAMAF